MTTLNLEELGQSQSPSTSNLPPWPCHDKESRIRCQRECSIETTLAFPFGNSWPIITDEVNLKRRQRTWNTETSQPPRAPLREGQPTIHGGRKNLAWAATTEHFLCYQKTSQGLHTYVPHSSRDARQPIANQGSKTTPTKQVKTSMLPSSSDPKINLRI